MRSTVALPDMEQYHCTGASRSALSGRRWLTRCPRALGRDAQMTDFTLTGVKPNVAREMFKLIFKGVRCAKGLKLFTQSLRLRSLSLACVKARCSIAIETRRDAESEVA
jgi:hypothetical protein